MAYIETYQWAWVVYLLAAVGMYYVVVKFTKYWRNQDVKNYMRMISAVILFTPASHTLDGLNALAPAYIVMLGELLTNGVIAALQGVIPILLALLLGAIALATQALINSLIAKYKKT
ncbi:hypothetical protein QNI23_010935 [Bermanella sp. WJH001]|uniref:hypothetical protein n=1 Tax=Bermanella sp. WJH001 TaxID=3048005 RepID=UPI0024BE6755|nr:hypothetical protein [Bermanella sp. WJH001]MDJ1537508.1 hypothetical protein [Bermanella sp. WJH001]